ncbi:MAG: DUF2299 family protein [Methermicoccaceae archaeon]
MGVNTPEEASTLVRRWLVDRNCLVGEEAGADVHFQYAARNRIGVNFVVVQPKALVRSVLVVARLTLHPEHFKALQGMEAEERHELIMDIRYKLLLSGAAFHTDPQEGDVINSLVFEVEIAYDELSEGRLIDAVERVQRSLLYVVWRLTDALGKAHNNEDYDMMVQ